MRENLAEVLARRETGGHGAAQLAAAIARGELSAIEAVEATIARIDALDARVHAVVHRRYEEAREEARAADRARAAGQPLGPLHGVPITLKECLDLAGTPSTFGLPSRRGAVATVDETHVRRLRQAGAIVVAKTNVAQLLAYIETDNPLFGRTDNPHDPTRSAGGSSGGEGALVGGGASPLGIGTDIGGSVRVPAAFCGAWALKPTSGRCDDLGRFSIPVGQRTVPSQVGLLGQSVADLWLGLEVLNGGKRPAPDGTLAPAMPLLDPVAPSRLRVAWFDDDGTFTPSPAVRRAVREAAAALEARGATVRRFTPPDVGRARDLFFGLLAADGFAGCRRALGRDARDPRVAQIEFAARHKWLVDVLLSLSGRGRSKREIVANYGRTDTDHYWQLVEATLDYRVQFERAVGDADVLLGPATALPAFRHGAAAELALAGAYTCLYNLLGWPAGVAPTTRVREGEESDRPPSRDKMDAAARETERGSTGLPVAVQLAARPWREDLVLSAMAALEPRS